MTGSLVLTHLPKGCYVVHHSLFAAVGLMGVLGFLSPTLNVVPSFGIAVSLGLAATGMLGVYSRLFDDAEVEVIVLRMMSGLVIGWALAVVANIAITGYSNMQGAMILGAYGTFLWSVAQGVQRGVLLDMIEIEKFILVVLATPTATDPDTGEGPDA